MRSPLYGDRRRSSDASTPMHLLHSRSTSTFSSVSTPSRKSAACRSTNSSTSCAVRNAARSIVDALFACFSPPESEINSTSTFNDTSASSDGRRTRRVSGHGIHGSSNDSTHTKEPGSVKFTMDEIHKATRNFSPTFEIGQGGFGTVYKGQLEDGTLVAVKREKKIVCDKHLGHEFHNEVQTLTQVEHMNLVKFYGFLEHEDERILVVEYVSSGTLREHLDCAKGGILDFSSRLDVAIDVAHAVTYLHTYTDHPIIHRDIKSSNILITETLRAKVADFGFARLAADIESGDTHVHTQVKGTAGYLDPEYMRTYQLTEKSDVYSFGVLLVELITGRHPIEPERDPKEHITVRWAIKKFQNGDAISTLDLKLPRSPSNIFAMEKIYELSIQCMAPHRNDRPTMKKCAEQLWSIRKDYNELRNSHNIPR